VRANERISIRNQADLDTIEQDSLNAFLSSPTPLALIEAAARARPEHCALHYLGGIVALRGSHVGRATAIPRAMPAPSNETG
jgi:hypothetical protein